MTGSLLLPVFTDAHVTGWPGGEHAPLVAYVDAVDAFTGDHATDAHVTAYSVPGVPHRLTLAALGAPALEASGWPMVLLLVDVDGPGHQRSAEWWAGEQPKLAALLAAHPGAFVYATRGGYRIVWRLASPFIVRTTDDKEAWRTFYQRSLLHLARTFGIVGDPACADITRLYRLPHATREPGGSPEQHETMGDPATLGAWSREPSADELPDDVETARTLAAVAPMTWGPVVRRLAPLPPVVTDDAAGVLEPADQDEARIMKRARARLDAMPPSITGQGGHNALLVAAVSLVRGFCLDQRTAVAILMEDFNPRCVPPWPRADVERKCREAAQRGRMPWGQLRDAEGGEAGLRYKPSDLRQQRATSAAAARHGQRPDVVSVGPDFYDQADEQPPVPVAARWPSIADLVARLTAAPAKLPTGVAPIDEGWRGGAPAGALWVIGGAPGAGKTTFTTWLAHEWMKKDVPVAFIAGDEPRDGILIRLGQQAGIDRKYLEEGYPVPLDDLSKHLAPLPLLLLDPDDDDGVTLEATAEALRTRWPEGPAVMVVDSLQAMARRIPDDVADSTRGKVDAVVKACKTLAKRHGLLIIMLSELARGAYRGGDQQTADIAATKESGSIEYEAGALCVLRSIEGGDGAVAVTWGKSRFGRVEPFVLRQCYQTASFTVEAAPGRKDDKSPEAADQAFREVMAQVADTVRRNQGTKGVPGVASIAERLRPGRRLASVHAAVRELLEAGVLENRGDHRRPKLFWVGQEGGSDDSTSEASQDFPQASGKPGGQPLTSRLPAFPSPIGGKAGGKGRPSDGDDRSEELNSGKASDGALVAPTSELPDPPASPEGDRAAPHAGAPLEADLASSVATDPPAGEPSGPADLEAPAPAVQVGPGLESAPVAAPAEPPAASRRSVLSAELQARLDAMTPEQRAAAGARVAARRAAGRPASAASPLAVAPAAAGAEGENEGMI